MYKSKKYEQITNRSLKFVQLGVQNVVLNQVIYEYPKSLARISARGD